MAEIPEERIKPRRSIEEIKSEIRCVIFDRFVQGYNTKDINRFISAFIKIMRSGVLRI